MFVSEIQIRVRYAETDQMGYVYYGNYAAYYEVARTEVFRKLNISYKKMECEGLIMPVLENHSYYLAPALYDDLLTVKVSIKEFPTVTMRFDYKFYNQNGILIHHGYTLLVFVKRENRKPCRVPKEITDKLIKYFEK